VTVQIEYFNDLPAILVTHLTADLTEQDVITVKQACHQLHQQAQQQIFLIHDIRNLQMNFSQLVLLLPMLQRQPHRLTDLPMTVYDVVSIDNPVLMIGIKAIQSGQYGKMDVKVVNSAEEALTAIRRRLQSTV
jgi:hypothetical protein